MVDTTELRNAAKDLRAFAQQIRRNNEASPYPTAGQDAAIIERGASGLEQAADEIESHRDEAIF